MKECQKAASRADHHAIRSRPREQSHRQPPRPSKLDHGRRSDRLPMSHVFTTAPRTEAEIPSAHKIDTGMPLTGNLYSQVLKLLLRRWTSLIGVRRVLSVCEVPTAVTRRYLFLGGHRIPPVRGPRGDHSHVFRVASLMWAAAATAVISDAQREAGRQ
jgi:hypothetical protein